MQSLHLASIDWPRVSFFPCRCFSLRAVPLPDMTIYMLAKHLSLVATFIGIAHLKKLSAFPAAAGPPRGRSAFSVGLPTYLLVEMRLFEMIKELENIERVADCPEWLATGFIGTSFFNSCAEYFISDDGSRTHLHVYNMRELALAMSAGIQLRQTDTVSFEEV